MATDEPLKRLGGGRWQTRDGRFTIEPQGGTWSVVDGEQTDDLGLPLVRGPFGSLTAAKEAIEAARTGEPGTSPLAERIEEAKARPPMESEPSSPSTGKPSRARPGRPARSARTPKPSEPPAPEPSEPVEPAWVTELPARRRQAARDLRARLESLGIADIDAVARAEIADGRPALTRLAMERRLRDTLKGQPRADATVQRILEVLLAGEDDDLEVRWRLVDGDGRPLADADA